MWLPAVLSWLALHEEDDGIESRDSVSAVVHVLGLAGPIYV
jgi:hypothetical protein